ncbi:hypothetical protein PUN28_003091 [Cardiocondyla obscurior]|uniref:Uncharacterized protein n=1 Tax=Cardiocondyla obscurior TaxID=286306 RepID=A0AAW2GJ67_9HYME
MRDLLMIKKERAGGKSADSWTNELEHVLQTRHKLYLCETWTFNLPQIFPGNAGYEY